MPGFERLVLGWLTVLSLACAIGLIIAFNANDRISRQASQAAAQSQVVCLRALDFAPALGTYFERVHALTPEQAAAYLGLLPSHC